MASTYSTVADLLIGDLPVAVGFSKQKFVDDAADEVDSIVGRRYVTPLDISASSPIPRHARLFIKRVANHLASGRLILALAAGGEDQALHAYGYSLVKNATDALEQIATGAYDIDKAQEVEGGDTANVGPSIKNVDASSGVETFYQNGQSVVQPVIGPSLYPVEVSSPLWGPGST